jgi:uncharacterized protein YkwD
MNPQLMAAAQGHAEWMAKTKKMSHTGEGGSSFWDRIEAEGYIILSGGENVAFGYPTPESVFDGWMNSKGHRRNIKNENWLQVGYGMAMNNSRPYWCTVFAIPSTRRVEAIIDPEAFPEPLSQDDVSK